MYILHGGEWIFYIILHTYRYIFVEKPLRHLRLENLQLKQAVSTLSKQTTYIKPLRNAKQGKVYDDCQSHNDRNE